MPAHLYQHSLHPVRPTAVRIHSIMTPPQEQLIQEHTGNRKVQADTGVQAFLQPDRLKIRMKPTLLITMTSLRPTPEVYREMQKEQEKRREGECRWR